MIQRKGLMFVLSSPSGAGKTTLSRMLLQKDDQIVMSISATTRTKRPGEEEGRDYYFLEKAEFEQKVENNQFLEHAKVFDNFYGTPKDRVTTALDQGIDVLFDIDWQGTVQLVDNMRDDVVTIFILPPSLAELETRLKKRAQDSDEVIQSRMAKAKSEISQWHRYDYVVLNHDLEQSLKQIQSILTAERLKRERQIGLENFISNL